MLGRGEVMGNTPCCVNCVKYVGLDLKGCHVGVCTVSVHSVKRSVAINGPMPCNGEYYKRKSVYRSTVIEVIRKEYRRE